MQKGSEVMSGQTEVWWEVQVAKSPGLGIHSDEGRSREVRGIFGPSSPG